ncbi:tripartite motif-containing protein 60-like [Sorex araneus]|uniref:tripartite motif-containing protein 60-like n=1 Tax=Sorex araneus TaxID=42254 RepID=UPI0024338AB7|nr:tripartite motif-containing protein 60-like [Sorex araneus]
MVSVSAEMETALEDLQAEASCFLCNDYLKNPVTITCGHNFCFSCINKFWEDLKGIFPCPICRICLRRKKFRRNIQLGNLTEAAKLLQKRKSKRRKQKEKVVCQKHNLVLAFFCEQDLEVLCSQCSFSSDHKKHRIWPVERAAPYFKKRLERCAESWKKKVRQLEKVRIIQNRKALELKKQVEHARGEIQSECERLKFYLQTERETILQQLEEEEMAIETKLRENRTQCSEYASSLNRLLKDIKSQSALALLTNVNGIYHAYKTLKSPELFSFQLKEYSYHFPPQYSGLDRIIKRFEVDVVLDPETAHHDLTVSEDRKTVRYGRTQQNSTHNPRKFYLFPAVLGSKGYNAGRHYWQVEVKDKVGWIVGVCKETFLGRNNAPNQGFSAQDGLWGIGRWDMGDYIALGPQRIDLLPVVMPMKIGVFLDCDLGEVSFYNLSDKSHLYTFKVCFLDALWPYFYAGTDPKPLMICPVRDSE